MRFQAALPVALGLVFIGAGSAHLRSPHLFTQIVPDMLPARETLVYISGVAEIAGGIGILLPRTRHAAGIGLIALLIAVFPANIFMALHTDRFQTLAPAWALYARLPLQFVFIALVVKAMRTP